MKAPKYVKPPYEIFDSEEFNKLQQEIIDAKTRLFEAENELRRWKRAIKTLIEYQRIALRDEGIEESDWIYNPHSENNLIALDRAYTDAIKGDLAALELALGIR